MHACPPARSISGRNGESAETEAEKPVGNALNVMDSPLRSYRFINELSLYNETSDSGNCVGTNAKKLEGGKEIIIILVKGERNAEITSRRADYRR